MPFGNNDDDIKGLLDKVKRNRNQIGPKIQQKGKGKKELKNLQQSIEYYCLVKKREKRELVIIFSDFPMGGGWRCLFVVFRVQLVPYIYSSPMKYSSVTISSQNYIYVQLTIKLYNKSCFCKNIHFIIFCRLILIIQLKI